MFSFGHIRLCAVMVVLMGFALLMGSCVSAKKFRNMEHERNTAFADRINAQQRIDNLEGMVKKLKTDTATCGMAYRNLNEQYATLKATSTQNAIALSEQLNQTRNQLKQQEKELYDKEMLMREREQMLQELQMAMERKEAAQRALVDNLRAALIDFSSEDLQIERRNGKVYVSLSEKLLFQSGDITLNETGKNALAKLAEALNRNQQIDITVEGHTDNVPIKTAVYKDNWDLSVFRATTVARLLSEAYGISATRILASGRGEFFPVAENTTTEGKARNRRTEIILMPRLDEVVRTLEKNTKPATPTTPLLAPQNNTEPANLKQENDSPMPTPPPKTEEDVPKKDNPDNE